MLRLLSLVGRDTPGFINNDFPNLCNSYPTGPLAPSDFSYPWLFWLHDQLPWLVAIMLAILAAAFACCRQHALAQKQRRRNPGLELSPVSSVGQQLNGVTVPPPEEIEGADEEAAKMGLVD